MEMESCKLFIGGISWETTEDRLREYFQSFGEVLEAVIMKDRATGRARGFGFLVFSDPIVAERVVLLRHVIDGKLVEAKKAVPRDDHLVLNKSNNTSLQGSPGPANSKKIFVGGLASSVTEAEFKKYFAQFGVITDVVVMYDHRTQRPRGFGFISFESEDAVDKVLQRTFHELNGKMVEVKLAVPKEMALNPIRNQMNVNSFGNSRISALLMNEYTQGFSPSPISGYGVKPEVRYSPGLGNRGGGFSPFGHGYGIELNFEPDQSQNFGSGSSAGFGRPFSPGYAARLGRYGSQIESGGVGNGSVLNAALFVLSLICFASQTALSWKKEEFRSCDQTPFCKRARSRSPGACSLIASDVSIADGDLVAKLLPKIANQSDEDQIKPLVLSLSVYADGIVRLRIDEDHTLNPPKKRFRVPDVVVSEFDEKKIWLQKVATERIAGDATPSSVIYVSDGYEAVVRHEPFEVFVREKSGDRRRVVSLNSHGLFDFEQLRKKAEGDNWEEKFRTHTDSRPYGSQSISFDVSFYDSSFVYGIPEHATSFALKPTKGPGVEESEPYRLFNLDVFEYDHESPFGLYGSIPFMVSHGKSGKTSGFFWLNAAEMQIDVLANGWDAESGIALPSSESRIDTLWMSEAGIVDTFFFVGPGPKDVVKQYASVTGTSAMPQLFATGYHQCRWNYKDEEDVAQVDSKFDEHDIPYDVLWLDIEHTDGKRYFTWDSALFPNPEEMQKKLAAKGRRMVTIVDPHIKRDDSYFLHKEATQMGYYVKDSSGKDFDGWCWPGSSSYIDMLSPEIREWWGGRFSYKNYVGSTPSLYIWNDMNEPSVFNGPEVTMPRDALHVGGVEHREVHNAYGYYFHMATSDGLVMREEGKDRPFVLSRAIFPGTQRYGAIWTGDNTAEWEHLRVSIPMLLTLGLTGITFSGADIGGFFGNPEPELLVRWYQVGAYYPFFRGHAHHDTKRREPWLFGERNTELMRDAIHTRYTLLPYFYTLFREANVTGVPVVRPLWMEFPQDEATFSNDEAFMVGNALLVQGVYTKGTTHASVYLPGKASWYDLRNGKTYVGGKTYKMDAPEESIPAFQRAGTIIPRKDRFRRSSSQMDNDPYTLVVALNSTQEADGELYIDDGKSFEFRRGSYIHRRFVFSNGVLTSTNLAPPHARLSSQCSIDRIILLGHTSGPKSALVEPLNQKAEIEMGPLRMGGLVASSGTKVLTIRKPGVRVDQDWTVKVL